MPIKPENEARYQVLKDNYFGADFNWDDRRISMLLFKMSTREASSNLDATVDNMIAAMNGGKE